MPLPAAVPVALTAAERKTLKMRVRGARTCWRDRLRAQIVLAAAMGCSNARIARRSLDMNQAYVRGRAFNLALLGTALARQGQIEEACAAGTKAIGIAAGLRSRRSIRYVLDLRRRLAAYADQPQVREFSERASRLSAARAGPR